MGRPFVAHNDSARACGLPLPLAAHQHFYARVEAVNFGLLLGHDVREVIDSAHHVGHLFFEFFHERDLGRIVRLRNGRGGMGEALLAPLGCIR